MLFIRIVNMYLQIIMSKIITIAHQKGGVGKSTLALNLAYSFAKNVNTLLTDIDPQGSTIQLSGITPDLSIIPFSNDIYSQNFEALFIDTPPYLMNEILPIFLKSDVIIIPTKPGVSDIMAIRSTVDLVKGAKKTNKKLRATIVLNMVKPRASITERVKEKLKEYGLPIIDEIKVHVAQPTAEVFVRELMRIIEEKGVKDRVIIQSFDPRTLELVHRDHPGVITMLNATKGTFEENMAMLTFLPTYYAPNANLINQELVDKCNELGIKLLCGNNNSKKEIDRVRELGINEFCSDYPYELLPN